MPQRYKSAVVRILGWALPLWIAAIICIANARLAVVWGGSFPKPIAATTLTVACVAIFVRRRAARGSGFNLFAAGLCLAAVAFSLVLIPHYNATSFEPYRVRIRPRVRLADHSATGESAGVTAPRQLFYRLRLLLGDRPLWISPALESELHIAQRRKTAMIDAKVVDFPDDVGAAAFRSFRRRGTRKRFSGRMFYFVASDLAEPFVLVHDPDQPRYAFLPLSVGRQSIAWTP